MIEEGVVSGFLAHVARALRCWRRDPRLPLTVLVIAALEIAPVVIGRLADVTALGMAGSVVLVVTLGFRGTTRVWYLEIEAGRRVPATEIVGVSRALWKRFFGLGVYVTVLAIAPSLVVFGVTEANDVAGAVAFLVLIVALDALLTFATVALAFWEMKAGEAVRYSWAVTKAQWPRCALYVLAAPLALRMVFTVMPARDMPVAVFAAVSLAIAVVELACKGATVLFYADRYLTAPAPAPLDAD